MIHILKLNNKGDIHESRQTYRIAAGGQFDGSAGGSG
jgi:hypothetical protein